MESVFFFLTYCFVCFFPEAGRILDSQPRSVTNGWPGNTINAQQGRNQDKHGLEGSPWLAYCFAFCEHAGVSDPLLFPSSSVLTFQPIKKSLFLGHGCVQSTIIKRFFPRFSQNSLLVRKRRLNCPFNYYPTSELLSLVRRYLNTQQNQYLRLLDNENRKHCVKLLHRLDSTIFRINEASRHQRHLRCQTRSSRLNNMTT